MTLAISLSYLFLKLRTYSKENLIPPFYFKTKTKITKATLTILTLICLFPDISTEVT